MRAQGERRCERPRPRGEQRRHGALGVDLGRRREREAPGAARAHRASPGDPGDRAQLVLVRARVGPLVAPALARERAAGHRARAHADLRHVATRGERADRNVDRAAPGRQLHASRGGALLLGRGADLDGDGAGRARKRCDVQGQRLARDARAAELDLRRLEPRIAHEPAEEPVPERAVPTAGEPGRHLAEAEPVRAVERDRHAAPVAELAEREQRHRLPGRRLARRVLPQHERAVACVVDEVGPRHRRQLGAEERAQRPQHRRGQPRRGRMRDDVGEIVVRLAALARARQETDGQHALQLAARVPAVGEGARAAHHHEPAARLDVLRQVAEVAVQPVRDGVEVLQDDGVEARQVLGEELVDGEADERELGVGRADVAAIGAKDEEGDDVDGCVGLEPRPQRADVVRRTAGDVEHAHALARDVEHEQAPIVVGDLVAGRRLDRDLDEARAGAVERHRQIEQRRPVLDPRHPRREQGGGRAVEQLADRHRQRVARQAAGAPDLDRDGKRLVRDRGARRTDGAHAGVAQRGRRGRDGVHGYLARLEERLQRAGHVACGGLEPAVADDDDGARRLTGLAHHGAQGGHKVGPRAPGRLPRDERRRGALAEADEREPRVPGAGRERRDRARGRRVARATVPGQERGARAIDEDDDLRPDARPAREDGHRPQHGEQREQRREHARREHERRRVAPPHLDDEQDEAHQRGERREDAHGGAQIAGEPVRAVHREAARSSLIAATACPCPRDVASGRARAPGRPCSWSTGRTSRG